MEAWTNVKTVTTEFGRETKRLSVEKTVEEVVKMTVENGYKLYRGDRYTTDAFGDEMYSATIYNITHGYTSDWVYAKQFHLLTRDESEIRELESALKRAGIKVVECGWAE
jgi:hypothetical protein